MNAPRAAGTGGVGWLRVAVWTAAVAATAAKLAAFHHDLSFAYGDAYKTVAGGTACVVVAVLWWWLLAGLGRFALVAAWWGQSLYLAVCWSYFSYFGLHLTLATALSVGGEGATAVGFGAIPLTWGMLWLLADLPFVLWRDGLPAIRRRWAALPLALLLAVFAWQTVRADRALRWAENERDDRYTGQALFVLEFGLLPIQLRQVWRGPSQRALEYGPEIELRASSDERRDVLIVQVESLDVGAIESSMPLLAARAAQGVWYPRCLAYHGPGGSSDCDVAVIEGVEPLWDAVAFDQPHFTWSNSWVARLRAAGWDAALAHGLPGAYFNFAQVMPRLGYELLDLERLGLVQHPGEFGARDNELVDAVLGRLPALASPYVLHVVTMTSHQPFVQHKAWWKGPVTGDDYHDSMACVDAQLDRLIAGFLARSPRGLVVLFGDHAAALPTSAIERSGGSQREYVPLLFLGNGEAPRRDPRTASFLDVGRTMLPAAGWSGPLRTWGADLLPVGGPLPPTRLHGRPLER